MDLEDLDPSEIFDFQHQPQVEQTWIALDTEPFYFAPRLDFNQFVRGNAYKHLLVLDSIYTYVRSPSNSHTGENVAALFALVLLSLRHFISYLPPKIRWILESPLAEEDEPEVRPGLGLGEIME
jgi:hypothetical protein